MFDNIFENDTLKMDAYKGKTLLLLNVASFWGFTFQYYALNDLVEKFQGKNFSILAVPCNQFAYQEPAANATELYNTMAYVRPGKQQGHKYVPKFEFTKKLDVNGENAHPIMEHLRAACPPPEGKFGTTTRLMYEPKHGNDVRWNFEKWLITKEGKPFRRYTPWTVPEEMHTDIAFLVGDSDSPRKDGKSREYA